jgi:hypothetical protein
MQHTFYGVFDDDGHALAAAAELRAKHCPVIVHRGELDAEELDTPETSARSGLAAGGLVGAAAGAVVGGLVLGPAGAGLGAIAGTLFGLVGGGIVGSHAPEHRLAQLTGELRAGHVILAVEPEGLRDEESAEDIVRRNGGRVEHRALV